MPPFHSLFLKIENRPTIGHGPIHTGTWSNTMVHTQVYGGLYIASPRHHYVVSRHSPASYLRGGGTHIRSWVS